AMPITRTPIIDDDGTGTTGTVLDNAWKQELYAQIDALATGLGGAGSGPHTMLSATHTDTTAAALVAGDLLIASGAPPQLTRLAKAADGALLNLAAGLPAWGGGQWQTLAYNAALLTAATGTF